ncbi:hypothetical protein GDO86_016577 [Hymenochirus boettgeri]|uniref:Olfactory receptor n=1 Tax=Hymenochirus boettgeri TaxID=247094 RepID=A0A8T2JXH4_9PIPI|nr:hypothetical protein GDO86_016577 [Hymenochirus boettgeri]
MNQSNQTTTTNFILLGLSNVPPLRALYFVLILIIYMITLSGNLLIITVMCVSPQLRNPMYFFLSNLSCVDILLSSSVVPQILVNTLTSDKSITFMGCAIQVYILGALGVTECVILGIMAYDRYAAICRPLHYNTIMNKNLCSNMASGSWAVSFLYGVPHVYLTFQLPFCKSNQINQFFCEVPPLLHLSCKDTWFIEIVIYSETGPVILSSFLLTLVSYIYIVSTILKISSARGKYKTFSTCASHVTVVTLFYGNILITYMQPKSNYSPERDRALSLLYTAVTPMLNPVIYTLRNNVFIATVKESFSSRMNRISMLGKIVI